MIIYAIFLRIKNIIVVIIVFMSSLSYSQNWQSNFEAAKTLALKENKNILLVFSGSDWCAPCIKLENIVWKSEAFKSESEKNWVIYKADFPKKKANQLTPELMESNNRLAEKYNRNGNFPLVVLLDKTEKVIGMTGFKNISPAEYIQLIHSLEK